MNTLTILAMAMVIYLFGGYLDAAEERATGSSGQSYHEKDLPNAKNLRGIMIMNWPRSIADWWGSFRFPVIRPVRTDRLQESRKDSQNWAREKSQPAFNLRARLMR